jgi:hypothetical protein
MRLSGERGLIYPQVVIIYQTRVRRDSISFGQQDNVAGDQFFRQDALLLACAQHAGINRKHLPQGFGGFPSPEFLPKAENAVDQVDQPDSNRKLGKLRDKTHNAGAP